MRKANEALAQREKQVEPVVKEKPIETEVLEIEGFIVDFEGTIENAKNIARYACMSLSCEQNTISTFHSHSFIFSGKCTRDTRNTHTGYNNCFY
jgi:hypothetical protein